MERTYVSSNIKKVTFANTEGYSNPAVDTLFETARLSGDPEERKQAFFEVQKLLTDEVPVVWLMEMSFPTIHDRRVTNLITTGTGVHACFDDVFIA